MPCAHLAGRSLAGGTLAGRHFKAVIPECRSRESVFAVVVLLRNDRSPTKFLGDDDKNQNVLK
ncbi:hypothetical protein [Candidatus Avelusimicrobium sp.]|uniref:hypothetical protein n=1 Tax=Candidatus Avelusimicrobium sp. TaxID=3048833 RepID=UPI003D7ED41D